MNNPFTKYTETFHEFIKNNPSFLNDNLVMSTIEKSKKLIDSIIAMYRVYEIGSETEDLFMLNFVDVFTLWKDYYEEKLTAYEKEYDYALGNKRRYERRNSITTEGNKDSTDNSKNKHTEIELPNKIVSSDYDGYPNDISKDDSDNTGHSEYQTGTNIIDDSTTYYDNEFLMLKEQYMKQIKNLYREFAMKFKECFLIIY